MLARCTSSLDLHMLIVPYWYLFRTLLIPKVALYRKAKSCVKTGNVCSDYFYCYLGVRQGENLSPVLFAIYLNDLLRDQKDYLV